MCLSVWACEYTFCGLDNFNRSFIVHYHDSLFNIFFFQNQVAYPLYVLYQAIKGQCEKGPVDAFTGQSHFSLNFDYLLDEDVEFEDVVSFLKEFNYKVFKNGRFIKIFKIMQPLTLTVVYLRFICTSTKLSDIFHLYKYSNFIPIVNILILGPS